MNYKNMFLSVFENKKYHLPLSFDEGDTYYHLHDIFQLFQNDLRKNDTSSNLDHLRIQKVCTALVESVELYYSGYPKKGQDKFDEGLGQIINSNIQYFNKSRDATISFDNLSLFRIRKIKEDRSFKRQDIFHVPFRMRNQVSTSRFSIAGYPSLYLGTSVDLCRIESNLSLADKSIVSEFQINRNRLDAGYDIRVLDLAVKPGDIIKRFKDEHQDVSESVAQKYIEIYPLIAACSIMAKVRAAAFVPEYIVPQYLMQWLRAQQNSRTITGIRYFTCRSKAPKITGYNYVFPVSKSFKANTYDNPDYCSILARCFKLTQPLRLDSFESIFEIEEKLKLMQRDHIPVL